MKYRILWMTLVLALLLAGCGNKAEQPTLSVPDFTVYNEQGDMVKLSDFCGKPVVLNFWASWCPPCKAEMPEFDEQYKALGDRVQFLMVNITTGDDFDTARAYIDQQGYAFPVYYDFSGEAAYYYQVQNIPATFFIGADGQLLANEVGMLSKERLQSYLELLLESA